MKKAILIALAFVAPAFAQGTADTERRAYCASIAQTSFSIMRARQVGVPLTKMLGVNEKADESLRPLVDAIVIDAYKRPRYATPEMQNREITEFSNEVHLACLNSINK